MYLILRTYGGEEKRERVRTERETSTHTLGAGRCTLTHSLCKIKSVGVTRINANDPLVNVFSLISCSF